ncbi:MAG: HDIG domain-containing metalloprotein [Sphaerochaetaceae bacterium]
MKKSLNNYAFSNQKYYLRLLIVLFSLIIMVMAILVPYLLSKDITALTSSISRTYKVGSLAHNDLKASETFYYIDEGETKIAQQAAAEKTLPIFKLSEIETNLIHANLEKSFNNNDKIKQLPSGQQVLLKQLVERLVNRYTAAGIFNANELKQVSQEGYQEITLINGEPSIKSVENLFNYESVFSDAKEQLDLYEELFRFNEKSLVVGVLESVLRENVFYDLLQTKTMRQDASTLVEPVTVKVEKGQYILKKDHVIKSSDIKALMAMRIANSKINGGKLVGQILFVLIVTAYAFYAFYTTFDKSNRRFQYLMLFLAAVFLSQIATLLVLKGTANFTKISNEPFLPLFVAPIVLVLVTNLKRCGIITALLLGSYGLLLPQATISTLFFVVGVSAGGIYFIRYVTKRVDMLFQWSFTIVWAVVILIVNNLFNGYGLANIASPIGILIINISVTFAIVSVLLPLLELIWNFPTPFRLRELAYSDLPALTKLSQQAVGTYNHSMQVSEMAHRAAEAIGADPLLARVGAMYHDIGKIENADYFIENQLGNNKHDDLKASLSVAIIKSHLKVGIEKAREARLPQEVIDIVAQHHGNDVIAIFLKEAEEAARAEGSSAVVEAQDYAYNGLVPQSREAAIVMLADGVEAASRSIAKPTLLKYERLVNQIFMGKIERKQLISSGLSITDLDTISFVFVQFLTGRDHKRIEYPNQQQEQKSEK